MNYPTLLLHRHFDCGQGLIKVNMYFEDSEGIAAILLRFYDIKNFYAVEVNLKKKTLRVVKKIDGNGEEIKSVEYMFLTKVWYRFRIVMYDEGIKVYVQEGEKRRVKTILVTTDPDIQRGTLALTTDSTGGVIFDSLEIKEFDPRYGIDDKGMEYMNFDMCLQGSSPGKRKGFCKEKFAGYEPGIKKCQKSINYCQYCCDSVMPRPLQILNFACFRSCLDVPLLIQEIRRVLNEQIQEAREKAEQTALDSGIWIPIEGEKVDIKPNIGSILFIKEALLLLQEK